LGEEVICPRQRQTIGERLPYFLGWVLFSLILLGFTFKRTHPYRFTRFLAFESLLSLIFLNAEFWFQSPFSFLQILSWLCLAGAFLLAVHGFTLIKTKGNPEGDIEDTTTLITTGAYRYIRHPLYTSLLLFGLGVFLKDPSLPGAGLLGTNILGVVLTSRIEEKYNMERFGEVYQDYTDKTYRFIPYIY
jgi:protein-S-isoprenylcysteine O-methyltransferase Ste14